MKALYNATEVISGRYILHINLTSGIDPGTLELSPDGAARLAEDLLQWLPEETVKRIREDL